MNLAICDDDSLTVKHISSLCEKISMINTINTYSSPETLFSDINAGSLFDVLILDIDLKTKKNGIDYAAELYKISPQTRILFTTAYTERFIQHMFLQETALIGFLSKPIQENILAELLQKSQNAIDADKKHILYTSGKSASESIPCKSIFYLESDAHKIYIHTESKTYTMYERLSIIAKQLPSNFLQCHKSYLVNMDKIKRIDKKEIFLLNNTVLQISKSHSHKVKETYFQYMQKTL